MRKNAFRIRHHHVALWPELQYRTQRVHIKKGRGEKKICSPWTVAMRPLRPLTACVNRQMRRTSASRRRHFAYDARKEPATWHPSQVHRVPVSRVGSGPRVGDRVGAVGRWVEENKKKELGARHDKGVDLALIPLLAFAPIILPPHGSPAFLAPSPSAAVCAPALTSIGSSRRRGR